VTEELARPGSGPTGARFWALRLGCNCSLFSISVSAKPAAWSSAASFKILVRDRSRLGKIDHWGWLGSRSCKFTRRSENQVSVDNMS
jgi:hypothetical protein